MDIMQLGLVTALCAMTALIANMCAAVFHDGIRPILPQLFEGNMTRRMPVRLLLVSLSDLLPPLVSPLHSLQGY